jgi:hypothetical protein
MAFPAQQAQQFPPEGQNTNQQPMQPVQQWQQPMQPMQPMQTQMQMQIQPMQMQMQPMQTQNGQVVMAPMGTNVQIVTQGGPMPVANTGQNSPWVLELRDKFCCCCCVDMRTGAIILGILLVISGIWEVADPDLATAGAWFVWVDFIGNLGCGFCLSYGAYIYNVTLVRVAQVWLIIRCVLISIFLIVLFIATAVVCSIDTDETDTTSTTSTTTDTDVDDVVVAVVCGVLVAFCIVFALILVLNIWFTWIASTLASGYNRARMSGVPPPNARPN